METMKNEKQLRELEGKRLRGHKIVLFTTSRALMWKRDSDFSERTQRRGKVGMGKRYRFHLKTKQKNFLMTNAKQK